MAPQIPRTGRGHLCTLASIVLSILLMAPPTLAEEPPELDPGADTPEGWLMVFADTELFKGYAPMSYGGRLTYVSLGQEMAYSVRFGQHFLTDVADIGESLECTVVQAGADLGNAVASRLGVSEEDTPEEIEFGKTLAAQNSTTISQLLPPDART